MVTCETSYGLVTSFVVLILFKNACATLYLNLVRPLSAGIEDNMHHLHIREIEAYATNDSMLSLTVDSFDSQDTNDPVSNTIDSNYSTIGQTFGNDTSSDRFFKYEISDIDNVCLLDYVKIYNRDDSWSDRIVGSYLEIINNSNGLFGFNLTYTANVYRLSLYNIDNYLTLCNYTGIMFKLFCLILLCLWLLLILHQLAFSGFFFFFFSLPNYSICNHMTNTILNYCVA